MTLDFDAVNWNIVNVTSTSELEGALSNAQAGDKIIIASGTYNGNFELTEGGSQNNPIWIVGEDSNNKPILDGGDFNNGTALHIDGADNDNPATEGMGYIYIQDLALTNARAGTFVDKSDYVTIDNLEVYNIGQAGIHIRDGSKYTIIKNSYIHDAGLYNVKFGEGIYLGSDYKKWDDYIDPDTGLAPNNPYDPSVFHVQIINNIIGPNITAEHIDLKEGTSYAYIIGNTFNAAGMKDILNGGLSYIDFKGSHAECAFNKGDDAGNEYFENAFEINRKGEDVFTNTDSGYNNSIYNNTLTFDDANYSSTDEDVTLTLALRSSGDSEAESPDVVTTNDIKTEHWVVKDNVKDANITEPSLRSSVSDNTRDPIDVNKMYKGDYLVEYSAIVPN